MPLDSVNPDFVNIIPQNNLRLPDALTVKHGPAPLLSRFTILGDRFFRENGVQLRLRRHEVFRLDRRLRREHLLAHRRADARVCDRAAPAPASPVQVPEPEETT